MKPSKPRKVRRERPNHGYVPTHYEMVTESTGLSVWIPEETEPEEGYDA